MRGDRHASGWFGAILSLVFALGVASCGLVVSFDDFGGRHGSGSFDVGVDAGAGADASAGSTIRGDATLASLTISAGALSPAFQPTTLQYTTTVRGRGNLPWALPVVSQTTVTATATDPDAGITIAGRSVPSGTPTSVPIDFNNGSIAPLHITVTSTGQQTQDYAVSISVARSHDYIKASDTQQGEEFSEALALSGDTLAVGAGPGRPDFGGQVTGRGGVYIFTRQGLTWSQQAHIDADLGSWSAAPSIALDGDTLAVRAWAAGNPVIYVFTRAASWWSAEATLDLSALSQDPPDQVTFGSIALSGATLAIGANGLAGSSVYVFTRSGTTWSQQASLYVPLAGPPVDPNLPAFPSLPVAVALSGDRLALGVPTDRSAATGIGGDPSDSSADGAGAVHVFVRTGATWSQEAYVKASNTRANAQFGSAVALSDATLVVGSKNESSDASGVGGDQTNTYGPGTGAVYVYSRSTTAWSQQAYLKATPWDGTRPYVFGHSVGLSGNTVVVGARHNPNNPEGTVFAFTRTGATWSAYAHIETPSPFWGNGNYGDSLAVSADTLAVGSMRDSSNATGINGDEQNQSAGESGAVFVF